MCICMCICICICISTCICRGRGRKNIPHSFFFFSLDLAYLAGPAAGAIKLATPNSCWDPTPGIRRYPPSASTVDAQDRIRDPSV